MGLARKRQGVPRSKKARSEEIRKEVATQGVIRKIKLGKKAQAKERCDQKR